MIRQEMLARLRSLVCDGPLKGVDGCSSIFAVAGHGVHPQVAGGVTSLECGSVMLSQDQEESRRRPEVSATSRANRVRSGFLPARPPPCESSRPDHPSVWRWLLRTPLLDLASRTGRPRRRYARLLQIERHHRLPQSHVLHDLDPRGDVIERTGRIRIKADVDGRQQPHHVLVGNEPGERHAIRRGPARQPGDFSSSSESPSPMATQHGNQYDAA